ncbi:tyrosine-type recombinase/integrase [Patulibacter sp. SYSU D01012]|uniref:tyrosine-type recombinase/integrase n=1 Tax=Patulibacter sp. SYSU D01012 TaxID=2817381 RepID=UPI001B30541E|nr:tyrosine-type recombinase/integrase [Patulibacter sp. SYSU D01012]
MSGIKSTTPSLIVRVGPNGSPFYEAKWRERQPSGDSRQVKRRLGPAWVEPDGNGGWKKRRGRTPDGSLDPRTAHVAAAAMVEAVTAESTHKLEQAAQDDVLTVRTLARDFLDWQRNVKRAKPSTIRDLETMLREPGNAHVRGSGTSTGRIMRAFGDRPAADVTAREVSEWLRELDNETDKDDRPALTPRTVNKYRSVLHSVFAYGMRADTHELPSNPVASTDKRKEPPAPRLDFYEVEEVEALARACEAGLQRPKSTRAAGPLAFGDDEVEWRRAEDRQDAEVFRALFYSGIRLGEALALRIADVTFKPDLSGAVLHVHRAVSAGVEGSTKGGRDRFVPVGQQGAQALARAISRTYCTEADDYVFCGRAGGRLDDSALRKRYKRACAAAGLRPIKLHGLRHAAGSIMARSMPLVSVRDVLGHAQLSTTNRYLHGKVEDSAIAAMNTAFGAAPAASEAPDTQVA